MPRRKRNRNIGLLRFAVLVAGIYVVVELVRSPLGLVLAAVSIVAAILYGRHAAKSQLESERRWRDLSRLRAFSGGEFETHVAETYRKKGYNVELTKATGDQGCDVIASDSAKRIAIQCKQRAGMVGNNAVQQALSGKLFYDCDQAVVVCTSDFTLAAKELARKVGVTLVNGNDYVSMVRTAAGQEVEAGVTAKWFPKGKPLVAQGFLFALGAALVTIHFAMTSQLASPAGPAPSSGEPLLSQRAAVLASPRPPAVTPMPSAPLDSGAEAVARFYALLEQRSYSDAYSLLSSNFQSQAPYEQWLAGYNTTVGINIEYVHPSPAPNRVSVSVIVVDLLPTVEVTRRFAGEWYLIEEDGGWRLDRAAIQLVP